MSLRKKKSAEGRRPSASDSFEGWVQRVNECVLSVDEGVGQLMEVLRSSGQLDHTLVVYASDQGFGMGEHGFRQKMAPYDATISSPLIVSWPGHVPEGAVCSHPVNAPDLVDFLCRAGDVSLPWQTHGRDIRRLAQDPGTQDWRSPMLMTHTGECYGADTDVVPTDERLTANGGVPWYALLRDGRFKYVRYFVRGETEELYDLVADPEELVNLASDPGHTPRLEALRALTIGELKLRGAGFANQLPPTQSEDSRYERAR